MAPDHTAFAVGETPFEKGDIGDQAYLIRSGDAELAIITRDNIEARQHE